MMVSDYTIDFTSLAFAERKTSDEPDPSRDADRARALRRTKLAATLLIAGAAASFIVAPALSSRCIWRFQRSCDRWPCRFGLHALGQGLKLMA
jgi:hypothetical protein